MDVLEVIKGRRSIKNYSDRQIEDKKLNKILEAGSLAPSAHNNQGWKFIVVREKNIISEIFDSFVAPENFKRAPVVIVVCGINPGEIMTCGQPRYTVDISIAMSFMMLEAYEQGLDTCWIGSYSQDKIKEILDIPNNIGIVTIMPIGYPAEIPHPKPRKQLDEIVSYNRYE